MKPEVMHDMMETMIGKMFSGMTVKDRIQFCTTVMPQCLTKFFTGITPDEKEKLKKEMINKMTAALDRL